MVTAEMWHTLDSELRALQNDVSSLSWWQNNARRITFVTIEERLTKIEKHIGIHVPNALNDAAEIARQPTPMDSAVEIVKLGASEVPTQTSAQTSAQTTATHRGPGAIAAAFVKQRTTPPASVTLAAEAGMSSAPTMAEPPRSVMVAEQPRGLPNPSEPLLPPGTDGLGPARATHGDLHVPKSPMPTEPPMPMQMTDLTDRMTHMEITIADYKNDLDFLNQTYGGPR